MRIKNFKPSRKSRFKQGYVDPNSCKKLITEFRSQPIIYRSSYERKFMQWLESSRKVKRWASECIEIPYLWVDGKWHKYYPDYYVEMEDGTKTVIEIKPYNMTQSPETDNPRALKEYSKNVCKWKAALEFCQKKGFKFQILTERTIENL